MMDSAKFVLDFDIKAVEPQADGSLLLRGYASTWDVDRDREAVQPSAVKAALAGYLSNPVLLWQHNAARIIGRITKAAVDAVGLLVEAVMPPPPSGSEAWHVKAFHDVKHGLYRAFSIGGFFKKDAGDNIIGMDLMEVSVVSVPANPTALFEVVQKAFDLEGDVDQKRGNEATLLRYWHQRMGEGGGQPGDFDACVAALSKHANIDDPKALCAWLHMQATGHPPGHAANETDKDMTMTDLKAAMTAAERNNLSDSDFGYVDSDGKGHFPLQDEAHVRAAITLFSRASFPDAATKKRCAAKILSRAKKYDIEVADDSAVAQAAHGKAIDIAHLKAVMAQLDADFDQILARS